MVESFTPYILATSDCLTPLTSSDLISITCSSVSLEVGHLLPRLLLPLLAMSRILSNCVPMNKCLGFTQALVSQVWRMYIFGGISPCANSKENLWAKTLCFHLRVNLPYPFFWSCPPVHSQQSFSPAIVTLDRCQVISFSHLSAARHLTIRRYPQWD